MIAARTGETMTDDSCGVNPRHKIRSFATIIVLTESAAIIQYLSETFSHPDLMTRAMPRVARYLTSGATLSRPSSTRLLYTWCRRHLGLEHIYGAAPKAVRVGAELLCRERRSDGAEDREVGAIT